jgi:uncharacterized protein (TIGR03083 family)
VSPEAPARPSRDPRGNDWHTRPGPATLRTVDGTRWLEAVERDGRELGRLCRAAPTATVRSCPDWTGADLLAHAAGFCRTLDELFAGRRDPTAPAVVVTPDEALTTFDDDLGRLLTLLRTTDPHRAVPNWSVLPDEAVYWVRRAAHEFAIHRWDAATTTTGDPDPVPADLARDGIAEFFEAFVATAFAAGYAAPAEATLVLEITDTGEVIRHDLPDPGPETRIRGTAPELFLAVWHRRDPVALHVSGDRTPLETWPHI